MSKKTVVSNHVTKTKEVITTYCNNVPFSNTKYIPLLYYCVWY